MQDAMAAAPRLGAVVPHSPTHHSARAALTLKYSLFP